MGRAAASNSPRPERTPQKRSRNQENPSEYYHDFADRQRPFRAPLHRERVQPAREPPQRSSSPEYYGRLAREALAALDGRDEQAPARTLADAGPDFEVTDEWPDEVWTLTDPDDDETAQAFEPADADEPTPLDLLAAGVPISGGCDEFEPGPADWLDYESSFLDHLAEIADGIELDADPLSERDVVTATGSF